jgi:rhodanese-related sulfurtransferase
MHIGVLDFTRGKAFEGALLVDLRSTATTAASHIPGAIAFDRLMSESNKADVIKSASILLCYGSSREVADNLARAKLLGAGNEQKIHFYDGGIEEWDYLIRQLSKTK